MISPASVLCARTFGLLILSVQPLYSAAVFAAQERLYYDIDAGPLDQALSRFGVQAGISLAGSSTLTRPAKACMAISAPGTVCPGCWREPV